MRSIKIKVWMVLVILSIGVFSVFFAYDAFYFGINIYNNIAEESIDLNKINTSSLSSENKRLNYLLEEESHQLIGFAELDNQSMSHVGSIPYHDGEKVYKTFKNYEETKQVYNKHQDYVLNVILVQWFSGRIEEAVELMSHLDVNILSEKEKDHYYLIQAAIDFSFYRLEEVEASLKEVSDDYNSIIKSMCMFMEKYYEYDVQIDHVNINGVSDLNDIYEKYFSFFTYFKDSYAQVDYLKPSDESIELKGKVLIDNEPFEGAIVYVSYINGFSTRTSLDGDYQVIDEAGEYKITTSYRDPQVVRILVPWHRAVSKSLTLSYSDELQDQHEQNFIFETSTTFDYVFFDQDGLHYKINDNRNVNAYVIQIRFYENYINQAPSRVYVSKKEDVIPMDVLKAQMRTYYNSSVSDDPLTLMNFTKHLQIDGEYLISVKPDQYVMNQMTWYGLASEINSALVTFEYGEAYNEGDLLIEAGHIDEAIMWYEAHPTEKNLEVLFNLYYHGKRVELVDGYYYDRVDKDYDAARRVIETSIDDFGETYNKLDDYHDVLRDLEDYEAIEEVLKQLLSYQELAYYHLSLGKNYIRLGEASKGIQYIQDHVLVDSWTSYVELFILAGVSNHLPGHVKEAFDGLDLSGYEPFFTLFNAGHFKEAEIWLSQQKEGDIRTMYELLLLRAVNYEDKNVPEAYKQEKYQHGNQHEYYIDLVNAMKSGPVKAFLIKLKKPNNWFHN